MEGFNKGQRVIVIVILVLLLFISVTTLANPGELRADSGWDSDYGGGGWSDSGGGWSSSGSWGDSDWSSSDRSWSTTYYRSTKKATPEDIIKTLLGFILIMLIIGLPYIIRDLRNGKTHTTKRSSYKPVDRYGEKVSKYEEFMANYDNIMEGLDKGVVADIVEDHEITEILPDETRESLLNKLYDKFVEVQKAWMDFDYDKLRELCSDELFNTYQSQLEVLKLKNGKNIMDNFELVFSDITGLEEKDGIVTIDMYLKVSFNDFVINAKTKKVIRGRDDVLMTNNYKLKFIIGKGEIVDTCPNCGAKIPNNTSGVCEYCGSHVVIKPKDYVLTKKNIIK